MTANPASDPESRAPDQGVQIPPPPWQRLPDRQARRRKEPISRDAIVAAAVQLLDREGLADPRVEFVLVQPALREHGLEQVDHPLAVGTRGPQARRCRPGSRFWSHRRLPPVFTA